MKEIILSTSLLLLLGTTTYAETKTPEVLKAEKSYNDRMTKLQNTVDKASKQLQVDLDKYGYIVTDKKMRTSVSGIFAAGDVVSENLAQVAVAVGDGAKAAVAIREYLQNL